MSDVVSFMEIDGQHVELLPARTLLQSSGPVTDAVAPVGDAVAPVTDAAAPVTDAAAPVTDTSAPDSDASDSDTPATDEADGIGGDVLDEADDVEGRDPALNLLFPR